MYRTEVLPRIDLNPPGLVIEDFNMTFEVYQKRLGKVAFTLDGSRRVTQDPDQLRDYVKQTRRWALGLWQTVRRHPPQANLFTAMLAVLLLELITASAIFVLLPLLVRVLVHARTLAPSALHWVPFFDIHASIRGAHEAEAVLFGVAVPDYAMTCLVAILDRPARPAVLRPFLPAAADPGRRDRAHRGPGRVAGPFERGLEEPGKAGDRDTARAPRDRLRTAPVFATAEEVTTPGLSELATAGVVAGEDSDDSAKIFRERGHASG